MMRSFFGGVGVMLLGILISSIAQVVLKKSALKQHDSLIREYFNKSVIFSYGMIFLASFSSIYAYKVIPLSVGTLLSTMEYVFVTFWGVLIFKEKINIYKALALVLIIIGILIYTL